MVALFIGKAKVNASRGVATQPERFEAKDESNQRTVSPAFGNCVRCSDKEYLIANETRN